MDVNSALGLLANVGVAGIGLVLFVKGAVVTGAERDHWRTAYENERQARTELEKTLAIEAERAATAIENAKVNRQLLLEMKAAGREGAL
jgi:hypothetical protein